MVNLVVFSIYNLTIYHCGCWHPDLAPLEVGCWGERREQPAFGCSFDAVLWCGRVTPSTCPTTGYLVMSICYVAVMSEMVVRYTQYCHMRGSIFLEPGGYPLMFSRA